MIEVVLNDRLGKKVRVKCKYALRLAPYAPQGSCELICKVKTRR